MQLFVRCGGPVGTLAVDCSPADTVGSLKERLCARSAALGPYRYVRLQYAGTSLPDERQLGDARLEPGATLQLSHRLRGGGGDGGSTGAESRSCYLEMYLGKKADKVNPEEERLARWTRCQLSGELLTPPCVVDELGNVYNKDALIQRLLDKSLPPALAHITGLRSVLELKLHSSNGKGQSASAASQTSFQPSNDSSFSCPITGVSMNGRYRFVVLKPSGHVVSEKAVKEVPAVVEELAGGGKKMAEIETIPINPTGEQLDVLRAKWAARAAEKAAEKAASKKDKKRSAAAAALNGGSGDGAGTSAAAAAAGDGGAKRRSASPPAPGMPPPGMPPPAAPAAAAAAASASANGSKKLKLPSGATEKVYASLFTTTKPGQMEKETFCCRALSARGMNLT